MQNKCAEIIQVLLFEINDLDAVSDCFDVFFKGLQLAKLADDAHQI